MVDFKYKVTDIAKDFGISTKKVIETFAELTGETRKTGATFEENEVNALMEALTRETAVRTWASIWHPARSRSPSSRRPKSPKQSPRQKKKSRSRRPLSPSSPSSRKPPRQSRKRSRPSPPRMRSPRQHSPNRPSRKSAMISAMITSRPKSAAKSA